ncbi:MAG: ACP S-malonyltransferase, partial [Planctomycetes bacterium]|nr:ACP S-malonyltransferase [Planctomycetota bacterium]
AIMTVSIACWKAWQEFIGAELTPPDVVAGHSLGEYTSLVVSGVLNFEDAVKLVRERGRLMHQASIDRPGSMAAILGLEELALVQICSETGVELANINADDQIVISGDKIAVARALDLASARGARKSVPLPVSGAFHSSLMQPAADRLAEALEQTEITTPRCPVMSNVTAQPHEDSAQSIRRRLVEQLTSPVLWGNSCEWLASNTTGVWHELAPGSSLKGLMRRIDRSIKVQTHDEPESEA